MMLFIVKPLQMNAENTNFWFTLSKNAYVSFNAIAPLLLYNTINGASVVVSTPSCLEIVRKVYEPSHLGVIEIDSTQLDTEALGFVDKLIGLGIGMKIDKTASTTKPINFLPILKLQNDVDKLISTGETHIIGDHISDNLTSLTLYISNPCSQNCEYCGDYHRQTFFCTKSIEGGLLSLELIADLLKQSSSTHVRRVNILGGNLTLYPDWNKLIKLFDGYSLDYHLWFDLHHINDFDLKILPFHKEILVKHPFNKEIIEKALSGTRNRNEFTLTFIVSGEEDLSSIDDLMRQLDQIDYQLVPFYNGENIDFISKNVYLDEHDILSEKIEMRKIFCNQKLNTNFFGSLFFFPDGSVKASTNTPVIGKFPDNSLIELIYNELVSNTAWRNVRGAGKCNSCMYRFLCPPPGNLEFFIGKQDLCHVSMKVESEILDCEK